MCFQEAVWGWQSMTVCRCIVPSVRLRREPRVRLSGLFLKICIRFEGHTDWVFGIDFVGETVLATCSRDKDIRLWEIPQECAGVGGATPTLESRSVLHFHSNKVRAMRFSENTSLLASVASDRWIHFSDVNVEKSIHWWRMVYDVEVSITKE